MILKLSGAILFALTVAMAFAAYLRPDMLVNFANFVLCY
jgi:hypothetical protein